MAEEAAEAPEVKTPLVTEEKNKGGNNPLATLLLIINTLGLCAIGFFQYQMHLKNSTRPSIRDIVKAEMKSAMLEDGDTSSKKSHDDGKLFTLDAFTANLVQGDGPRRYIRLNVILKFSKESKEMEFKSRKPQIRDTIITLLNSKRPEDILKKEGKAFLKEEIKDAINSFLRDGHVKDIYYVDFQVH